MTGRGRVRRGHPARQAAFLVVLAAATCAAGCSAQHQGSGSTTSSEAVSAVALVGQGVALESHGNTAGARQLFERAISLDPGDAVAYYDIGVLDQDSGNIQAALNEYGAALSANPRYVPALYNQAIAYEPTAPALAMSDFREVIGIQPGNPTAFLNLGLTENKAGQVAQAKRDLLKSIQLEPSLAADIPRKLLASLRAPATTTTTVK